MMHADLVILDSRITPHDLRYLNAFVKPKLLEDSKAEGSKFLMYILASPLIEVDLGTVLQLALKVKSNTCP